MLISIYDMVKEWLEQHGCDGLCNGDGDCACRLDDLFPCGEPHGDNCMAAKEQPLPEELKDEFDFCFEAVDIESEDTDEVG